MHLLFGWSDAGIASSANPVGGMGILSRLRVLGVLLRRFGIVICYSSIRRIVPDFLNKSQASSESDCSVK
jgi:hypothetical protein